jgi:CBS domain-containing protein
MAIDQTNIVVCPSCGANNIEGVDTCENCTADLRSLDVPSASQIANESDLALPISSVRLSAACTVASGATVRDGIALMRNDAAGAVVVLNGTAVAGIFTERDVLKKIAGRPERLDEPIAAYMTADPVVLREDDPMAAALNKMGDGGFRHVPVVRDGRLVGLITGRDVWAWVMGHYFD